MLGLGLGNDYQYEVGIQINGDIPANVFITSTAATAYFLTSTSGYLVTTT